MENVSVSASSTPISLSSRRIVDLDYTSRRIVDLDYKSRNFEGDTRKSDNTGDIRRYEQLPVSSYLLQHQQQEQLPLSLSFKQRRDTAPLSSPMSKSVAAVDSPSPCVVVPTNTNSYLPSTVATTSSFPTATANFQTSSSVVTSIATPSPLQLSLPSPSQPPLLVTSPHRAVYSQMPDMLWKSSRLISVPLTASHLHTVSDDILDQERAYFHKREPRLEQHYDCSAR